MAEKPHKLKMTKVPKNKDELATEFPLIHSDLEDSSLELSVLEESTETTRDNIGTIIGSNNLIWVEGMYYGRETVEESKLSTQIPIFAVTPQEHEGKKVKELVLVFTEVQKSMILMDNLNLEQDITTMDVFTKGIDDIFNEARFSALRIGSFDLDEKGDIIGFNSETPHLKIQIQQPVIVATDAQLSIFLDHTEFLFIRNFQSGYITIFQTILTNLFDKLVKFPNFNSDVFIQRVCEIGNSISPAIFSSILQDLEERRGPR